MADIITPMSAARGCMLTSIQWPIDRPRALVRAVTRLLLATILLAACTVLRIDWRMLWLTERFACLILVLILALLGILALVVAGTGIRWLLLVMWKGPAHVQLSPAGLAIRAGPFGRREIPWSSIHVTLCEGIDPDWLDQLPDDTVLPRLIDHCTGLDLAAEILKFARVSPDELSRVLRPLLTVKS